MNFGVGKNELDEGREETSQKTSSCGSQLVFGNLDSGQRFRKLDLLINRSTQKPLINRLISLNVFTDS